MHQQELSYFRLSKQLFPFDKDIIVSEALSLVRSGIHTEHTFKALKEALKYDPYSIEMLGMYIQFENAYGNKEEAKKAFNRLKQIGINTNIFKQLKQLDTMKGF